MINNFQIPFECDSVSRTVNKTYLHFLSCFLPIIGTLLNKLKLLKRPRKPLTYFLPDHLEFYRKVYKSKAFFPITILAASWSWKATVFNSSNNEKFFHQSFFDKHDLSKIRYKCVGHFTTWLVYLHHFYIRRLYLKTYFHCY